MDFSKFFIDRPIFAAVLSIVIFAAGLIAIPLLPIGEYPDVVPPSVVVRTVYPGANPKVIAETVATPLEEAINGRAGRVLVTVGNLAMADSTLLTTVVSQDPVYVDFEADERTWLRYGQQPGDAGGERAVVRNPVQVGLTSEDGFPHGGIVSSVDNQMDAGTGTIRARALVPNPDRVLMPGLFARVRLAGTGTAQALLVDDKAVLTDQDRKYLYVLGAGHTAQRRDVSLGLVVNGLRVVDTGLKPGDKVIVNGLQKVFMPGMPVAPKTVAMREATGAEAVAVVAQR
jgi:multidrug efflux system membrane fusion protein